MNNYVIAICVLLMMLSALVAFVVGVVLTLRYQRGVLRRTGYVQIGNDLYCAELIATAPEPQRNEKKTARQAMQRSAIVS